MDNNLTGTEPKVVEVIGVCGVLISTLLCILSDLRVSVVNKREATTHHGGTENME